MCLKTRLYVCCPFSSKASLEINERIAHLARNEFEAMSVGYALSQFAKGVYSLQTNISLILKDVGSIKSR